MRVTNAGSASLALAAMTSTAERVAAVQAQLASERRIGKPSDDPAGAGAALALRSETARDRAYASATSAAQTRLTGVDTALAGVTTALQRAQDLVRQGLNSGTVDADGREGLATQLDAVAAQVLTLANTDDTAGRPLFGGSAATGPAFGADGSYLGDTAVPSRVVGTGVSVPTGARGDAVFGTGADSVFAALSAAAAALRSGDTGAGQTALDRLGTAVTSVTGARTAAGATSARLDALADTAATTRVTRAAALSSLQDLDVAQVSIDLSSAKFAYQASLQVAASTGQTSLLDFLR